MNKRSGTYHQIYLHFVWSTKSRERLLDDVIKEDAIKVFHAKARELGMQVLEADGTVDHIHVLVKSNPSLAPSDIAKSLKGSSSHFINHVTLKDNQDRSLYWQDGYGVISVSPAAVKSVREYIKKQKEHHSDGAVHADFEL